MTTTEMTYPTDAPALDLTDFGVAMKDGEVYVRALSLWQPFASMVATGLKPIETRFRRTMVRGRFVVCSTQKVAPPKDYGAAMFRMGERADVDPREYASPPIGMALAIVKLVGCRPMTPADEVAAWVPCHANRWAWVLAPNPVRLRPFPVKGGQGWFRVPARLLVPEAA